MTNVGVSHGMLYSNLYINDLSMLIYIWQRCKLQTIDCQCTQWIRSLLSYACIILYIAKLKLYQLRDAFRIEGFSLECVATRLQHPNQSRMVWLLNCG